MFEDCESILYGYLSFSPGCALANRCHLSKQTAREKEGVATGQPDSKREEGQANMLQRTLTGHLLVD